MSLRLKHTSFWFIRHGQTRYNAAGLAQGALDIELNEQGYAQAQAAAPLLLARGITEIVTSPLSRARETAESLNRVLHLPLRVEADLREVSFGELEGQPSSPWLADFMQGHFTPQSGESFADLKCRIESVLARILATTTAPALIVSHGVVLRAVQSLLALDHDVPLGNAVPLYFQPTASGWQMTEAGLLMRG